MKKIISFILILLLTLCLGSCVFGAVGITTSDELEEFFDYYGYDIEFDTLTYPSSFPASTYINELNQKLNDPSYKIVIYENKNKNLYDRGDTNTQYLKDADLIVFYIRNNTSATVFSSNVSGVSSYDYQFYFHWGTTAFLIDTDTNSYYTSIFYIKNDDWIFGKYGDIPAEVSTIEYQRNLLDDVGLIYSEVDLQATNFIDFSKNVLYENQGGKITSNTVDDISYQGTLTYNPATEVCNITYTKGFTDGVFYDLFLEQYKLDNDLEYGVSYYPVDTIELFDVDKTATTVGISAGRFMDSIHYAYRICLGKNAFLEKGINDVYLCTDWLIPLKLSVNGLNTITSYKSFSTFHYMDFLGLDYYNPDDWHGDSDIENPSGDTGNIGGITSEPCFLNAPSGLIETDLGFEVDVISNTNLDVSNYYLAFTQYSSDFSPEFSQMIRDNTLWQNKENSQYSINLKDFYDFSGDKYFKVFLIKTSSGIIDSSDYFYTDPALIIPDDFDTNDRDEEEIKGGIAGIWQAITNLPKLIGDAIAGIFIPADGFFSDYFSELNDWFSERLGILYFPFDFIVDFFSRIYTSEFKDPTIVIPAMQIPLFEEYGNIYDGTTFNFKEFINQHETFMYIYNLYLIAVDGIVIFGLIRLLMKKYEEVTTNGN